MVKYFRLFIVFSFLFIGQINAQSLLQQLPILKNGTFTFQQSTYDRTGKNTDFCSPQVPNCYDSILQGKVNNPNGVSNGKYEYVICHVKGPNVLERYWMIAIPINFSQRIRFYFDGESTPRIDKTLFQLFIEQLSPFNKPLVQQYKESSGGFWSYIPMPIANDLIVTVDSSLLFSQFDFRQFSSDTSLTSYTITANNTFWINELSKAGTYPKNNATFVHGDSMYVHLSPHETKTIYQKSSAAVIEAINMRVHQIDYSNNKYIHDDGNFHRGTSKATFKINGLANSVKLVLRSNKTNHISLSNVSSLNTRSIVFVNNLLLGFWQLYNYRDYRFWQNDTLNIPKILYFNRSSITLQFTYNAGEPWNEAYYWIYCDGVLTDSLDVGKAASETAHNYSVTSVLQVPYTDITARYQTPNTTKQKNTQVLDSIFIRVYFDDETTPSIQAPIGLFFATGTHDIADVRSLYSGHINQQFYQYLSMPFWKNARIELQNMSAQNLDSIFVGVADAPNTYNAATTGYLKAIYRNQNKTSADTTDVHIAEFSGKGNYIGTVIQAQQNSDSILAWLEGDEHIYIDDAETPFHIGTGSEDYFNSTFYFMFDECSLAQNGMTNSDAHFGRCMYRFHAMDAIPFDKNIRFQIEHGDYNNKQATYQSLSYAYVNSSAMRLTDSLDVGNTTSENVHQYQTPNSKIVLNKTSAFEGEKYSTLINRNGNALSDSSEFTVQILPQNVGVRLLRTLDYSYPNQYAEVWVDGAKAGEWFSAGSNRYCQFRDALFEIPKAFTQHKSSLKIKIINKNSAIRWTELDYKVFTHYDSTVVTKVSFSNNGQLKIYPTLTQGYVFIETNQLPINSITISTLSGAILKTEYSQFEQLDLSEFPAGYYLISVWGKDNLISTQKIALVH